MPLIDTCYTALHSVRTSTACFCFRAVASLPQDPPNMYKVERYDPICRSQA